MDGTVDGMTDGTRADITQRGINFSSLCCVNPDAELLQVDSLHESYASEKPHCVLIGVYTLPYLTDTPRNPNHSSSLGLRCVNLRRLLFDLLPLSFLYASSCNAFLGCAPVFVFLCFLLATEFGLRVRVLKNAYAIWDT